MLSPLGALLLQTWRRLRVVLRSVFTEIYYDFDSCLGNKYKGYKRFYNKNDVNLGFTGVFRRRLVMS